MSRLFQRIQFIEEAARSERLFPPAEIQKTKAVRFPQGIVEAKTQEAAQGDLNISVKLLDAAGVEFGDAFDAVFGDADGVTAANAALPRVASGKTISVVKMPSGTWKVVTPTLTKSTACP